MIAGTEEPRIVGISLVRNEDLFVERALRNAVDFCDELLVADHGSTDDTPAILRRLQADEPRIRVTSVDDASASHELIAPYAGRRVWVFGVDGDELYEPERLAALRRRLLAGELDDWWAVYGHVLHCRSLDLFAGVAEGYLAPPSRSMTKLYNFAAIEEWGGWPPERLHGGELRFRAPYDADRRYAFFHELDWEDSPFRCLHTCFLPRSSRDRLGGRTRPNVSESSRPGAGRRALGSLYALVRGSRWKQQKYRRGPLVTKRVKGFFP